MFKHSKQLLLAGLILVSALQLQAGLFNFISHKAAMFAAKVVNTATKIRTTYGPYYATMRRRTNPWAQPFGQLVGYCTSSDEHKKNRFQVSPFSAQQRSGNRSAFGLQSPFGTLLYHSR